jgi:hypothetical protein
MGCPQQVWSNGSDEASVLVSLEWRHPPNGLPTTSDEPGRGEALAQHLAVLAILDNGVELQVGLGGGQIGRTEPVTPAMREMACAAVVAVTDAEGGNVWSGRGPRPGWFKAALEAR